MLMLIYGQRIVGWRTTSLVCALLVWGMTALLWLIFLITISKSNISDMPPFHAADCEDTRRVMVVVRFVVGAFATLAIVSSYNFMQLLVSPTREDVDRAHAQRRWMDIGCMSVKNLRFISNPRRVLFGLFALIWIPFHLLAPASVAETARTTPWVTVLATESFLSGGKYDLPGLGLGAYLRDTPGFYPNDLNISVPETVKYIAAHAAGWERLSGRQCLQEYGYWVNVDKRRHVVAVISTDDGDTHWSGNISSVWYAGICGFEANKQHLPCGGLTLGLNMTSDSVNGTYKGVSESEIDGMVDQHDNWIIPWHAKDNLDSTPALRKNLTVKYCLSEPFPSHCKARISNILLLAVCLLALAMSALCAAAMRIVWGRDRLVSIGDAVDSFIRRPDMTTRDMCTLGWRDFSSTTVERLRKPKMEGWIHSPRQYVRRRGRWGDSLHISDWMMLLLPGGVGFIICLLSLVSFVEAGGGWKKALSASIFGQNSSNPILMMKYPSENLRSFMVMLASRPIGASLVATMPQILLAILPLILRHTYTRMYIARTWSSYAARFKTLRVNERRGQQRGNYFFEIPFKYALGFVTLGAVTRWMCSNAIYVIHVESFRADPSTVEPYHPYVNVFVSLKAALGTIIMLFVILVAPIFVALIPLPGESVLVGSCSAAISAGCHVIEPGHLQRGTPGDKSGPQLVRLESDASVAEEDGKVMVSSVETDYKSMPECDWRAELAEGRLRWGVFREARSATDRVGNLEGLAQVLSFGSEETYLGSPREDEFYGGTRL
ncbi:hypothetical protein CKAH01_03622 [Colletotrichum kahawae]|uniref:DUF6536 domain-containing protein n=1 Tax=Colletotrichum kahawae TaxID=34407 RepID=A0AAD9YRG1_COLKA|nr:hypothetical protein CKAH01_03622 [Colletotrichum kahawae]